MLSIRRTTRGAAVAVSAAAFLLSGRPSWANRLPPIRTVFVILMENHNWSDITGSTNCPYITRVLLPMAASAERYFNPPGLHPSEPNYIWLEAGTNFWVTNDSATNRIDSTNHLTTLLQSAGISWKVYAEDIEGWYPPNTNRLNYRVRHNPPILFLDVSTNAAYCTNHIRPYEELAGDLLSNRVAGYNFLVPNLTNDMHNAACSNCSTRVQGDHWLSHEVPGILASQAYREGGALFITWDEGSGSTSDGPIGMIILSPFVKAPGYTNSIHYDHSSFLRTMQDIFGVRPYLHQAANATNLSDFFRTIELVGIQRLTNGALQFGVTNVAVGATNYVLASTNVNFANWTVIWTNVATSDAFTFTDTNAADGWMRFYRVSQAP